MWVPTHFQRLLVKGSVSWLHTNVQLSVKYVFKANFILKKDLGIALSLPVFSCFFFLHETIRKHLKKPVGKKLNFHHFFHSFTFMSLCPCMCFFQLLIWRSGAITLFLFFYVDIYYIFLVVLIYSVVVGFVCLSYFFCLFLCLFFLSKFTF